LKEINVRNNQLTKLELDTPKLTELIAGQNELTTLDLTNCQKIEKLMVFGNSTLTEIKGLNLAVIKNINIAGTFVDLSTDYEELKTEKEELLKSVKTLKEAAEEKG
jgi:Leucine-rich repeat (LRR) protein